MGEVSITIGGRSFKLGCDDGEEQHLQLLAEHLNKHVENLRVTIGKTGDEQLYLMAGLMVCDELWDSRNALAKLEEKLKARIIAADQVEILPPEAKPVAQPQNSGQARGQMRPGTPPGTPPPKSPPSAPAARPAAAPGKAAHRKPIAKQT